MTPKRLRSRGYVEDMLDCVQRIQSYTTGQDKEAFLHSVVTQDAVLRNIEVIGEASQQPRRVLPEVVERFPSIPFQKLTAMRNLVIHEYLNVNLDIIWNVIEIDLPGLRADLESVLAEWPVDLTQNTHP